MKRLTIVTVKRVNKNTIEVRGVDLIMLTPEESEAIKVLMETLKAEGYKQLPDGPND